MTETQEIMQKDFEEFGEYTLLANIGPLTTIYDVGANAGEWTKMARLLHPESTIHSFEISAPTYRKFLRNVVIDLDIVPNNFGLADKTGTIQYNYVEEHDTISSTVLDLREGVGLTAMGLIVKGDDYTQCNNVNYIDFMKIDVEGAEGSVLCGFKETFEKQRVGVVQFEYGWGNIPTGFLLYHAYKLLKPYGFVIGGLDNSGITFMEYFHTLEIFEKSYRNFVAIHSSKADLIAKLETKG